MRYPRVYGVVLGIATLATGLWGTVFKVGRDGDYSSISSAILWAQDGDTIALQSGTPENPEIYWGPVQCTVSVLIAATEVGDTTWRRLDHPDPRATVVRLSEEDSLASVFWFHEVHRIEVRGITIEGGYGTPDNGQQQEVLDRLRHGGYPVDSLAEAKGNQ